jgi:hypothetical protein
MYRKFEGPNWSEYMQWPNVIDAIANCTVSDDSVSRWGGRDEMCWNQLDCALTAADASQQAQYSSAATILGLVSLLLHFPIAKFKLMIKKSCQQSSQ